VVIQPVGVNISTVRPSAESNIPIPQGQSMANSAKLNVNSLAIPYNNNQLANLDLWDSLFVPALLLELKKVS